MKRKDLERKLRIAVCYLKREGASHSPWINPKTGVIEAVPRHNEIKEPLAKKIFVMGTGLLTHWPAVVRAVQEGKVDSLNKLVADLTDLPVENVLGKKVFIHKPGIKPGNLLFFGRLVHSTLQKECFL